MNKMPKIAYYGYYDRIKGFCYDRERAKPKTRRQQLGMPDRWRLLEKLDPTVAFFFPDNYIINGEEYVYKRFGWARKSQIEELRNIYGDSIEVL